MENIKNMVEELDNLKSTIQNITKNSTNAEYSDIVHKYRFNEYSADIEKLHNDIADKYYGKDRSDHRTHLNPCFIIKTGNSYMIYLYGLPVLTAATLEGANILAFWLSNSNKKTMKTMLLKNSLLVNDLFIYNNTDIIFTDLNDTLKKYGISPYLWNEHTDDKDAAKNRIIISTLLDSFVFIEKMAWACISLHDMLQGLNGDSFNINNNKLELNKDMTSSENIMASLVFAMLDENNKSKFQKCITEGIVIEDNKEDIITTPPQNTNIDAEIQNKINNCNTKDIKSVLNTLIEIERIGGFAGKVDTSDFAYSVYKTCKSQTKEPSVKQAKYIGQLLDVFTNSNTTFTYFEGIANANTPNNDFTNDLEDLKWAASHEQDVRSAWTNPKINVDIAFSILTKNILNKPQASDKQAYYMRELLNVVKTIK